jgi:hypothetical protein
MSHPTKYSFDDSTVHWNEVRKADFASRLHELVEDFNVAHNYGKFNGPFVTTDIQTHDPTLAYGDPKAGVHILNIVNLSEPELQELTNKVDCPYRKLDLGKKGEAK